ncbi:hypothetical protein C8R44DRAFT_749769 [Mycena epipterygia]|nr:hypothetical protein C8R44DRAFT_749769 [Mycena epipterygia]
MEGGDKEETEKRRGSPRIKDDDPSSNLMHYVVTNTLLPPSTRVPAAVQAVAAVVVDSEQNTGLDVRQKNQPAARLGEAGGPIPSGSIAYADFLLAVIAALLPSLGRAFYFRILDGMPFPLRAFLFIYFPAVSLCTGSALFWAAPSQYWPITLQLLLEDYASDAPLASCAPLIADGSESRIVHSPPLK